LKVGDIPPPKPIAPLPFGQGGNTDDAMMAAVQESVRQRARVIPTGTTPPAQAIEHPPLPFSNSLDVASEIAARRPAFVERVTGGAATAHSASVIASADVVPAPFQVIPTVYPNQPNGSVTVVNHITININSREGRAFDAAIDELLLLMRESNTIAGETRDQLVAELKAGFEILRAPKANPKLIELLLVGPLKYLADKAAGPAIAAASLAALAALGKLTGWW